MFTSIGRKGLEGMINTPINGAVAQKVANAVVNGAPSLLDHVIAQKAGHLVGSKIVKGISKIGRKRKSTPTTTTNTATSGVPAKSVKKVKVDIDKLINGSGIILD